MVSTDPLAVTSLLVTLMTVSVASVRFFKVMLPVPLRIVSLKVAMRFDEITTFAAAFAGFTETSVGGTKSGGEVTVMVVLSRIAEVVTSELPATSFRTAPDATLNISVPGMVGVTCMVNIPGSTSLTELMVTALVPALAKSAALTVAASMSSLKVMV
jgi:hypothetical protein